MAHVFDHAISGFMDAYVNGNNISFVDGNSGAVYKYSIDSSILTLNTLLYANNQCLRLCPRRIIKYEEYLYFISNDGYKICKGKFINDSIVVESVCEYQTNSAIKIKEAFLIDGEIWCVPSSLNQKVMIYDIKNEKFIPYNLYSELKRCNISAENVNIMTIKYADNSFFFTLETGTELIKYNVESRSVTRYEIPDKLQVSGFDYDGKYFWLRSKYGVSLYKWDLNEETIISYHLNDMNESEKGECNAKVIVLSNGKIVLLPSYCNSVIYLDQNEHCLKRVEGLEDICHAKGKERYTFSIGNAEIDGKLILYPWAGEQLISVDLSDMKAETHRLTINEEEYEKLQILCWRTKQLIYETEENTLCTLLKRLTHPLMDEFELQDSQKKYEKNAGKEIYNLTAKGQKSFRTKLDH